MKHYIIQNDYDNVIRLVKADNKTSAINLVIGSIHEDMYWDDYDISVLQEIDINDEITVLEIHD